MLSSSCSNSFPCIKILNPKCTKKWSQCESEKQAGKTTHKTDWLLRRHVNFVCLFGDDVMWAMFSFDSIHLPARDPENFNQFACFSFWSELKFIATWCTRLQGCSLEMHSCWPCLTVISREKPFLSNGCDANARWKIPGDYVNFVRIHWQKFANWGMHKFGIGLPFIRYYAFWKEINYCESWKAFCLTASPHLTRWNTRKAHEAARR